MHVVAIAMFNGKLTNLMTSTMSQFWLVPKSYQRCLQGAKLPYTRAMRIRRVIILLALLGVINLAMQALTSSEFYKHLQHVGGDSHAH